MRRAFATLFAVTIIVCLIWGSQLQNLTAANANVGYIDDQFFSGPGGVPSTTDGTPGSDIDATADKPQSKLWYTNDNIWWSVMFHADSSTAGTWNIYRLDWPNTWTDTHIVVDNRPTSRADALWSGSKLYIASLVRYSSSNVGRLYRYSYDSGSRTYTLDSGFPTQIMTGSAETLALDQDSTGRLWIAYTQNKKVYVNSSTTSDTTWSTPTTLKDAAQKDVAVGSDDIASLVAYNDKNGPAIGVLWSSHTSTSAASSMNFTYHKDSDALSIWQPIETIYGGTGSCLADDHINLKSLQADPSGAIFAALKTSVGDSSSCTGGTDLIRLVVRYPNNTWKSSVFASTNVPQQHTRPIVLLDTTNRQVYMFATAPTSCGVIYYKKTSMDNPSFAPDTEGEPFISSSTYTCINNATSTKQTVNANTGLVVLASDEGAGKRYLHNAITLGTTATSTPTKTPVATNTPTNTPSVTNTPTNTPVTTNTPISTTTPTSTPTAGNTRIKDVTFENASLTGTSGADAVVGTVALNNTTPIKGSYSATINTTSGYLREDFTATDELFVSFYFQAGSFPAAARVAQISNGSTTVGTLYVNTNGTLQLKNGSTAIGSASPALAAGTTYRIGLHQKKGTGSDAVLEAYVVAGDAPFGTPFAASAAQSFTTQATRLSLGATNSNAVNATLDDIRLDTATMP